MIVVTVLGMHGAGKSYLIEKIEAMLRDDPDMASFCGPSRVILREVHGEPTQAPACRSVA